MKVAFLEYTFIFDPSETWTTLWDFEKDLAKYLGDHGLEAEIIKTIEGQGNGKRLLFIRKRESPPILTQKKNPPGRPLSVRGIINKMTAKKPRAAERDFGEKKLKTDKIFNKVK